MEASKRSMELPQAIVDGLKEGLERGGKFAFRVYGRSMHPTMIDGELVHVTCCDSSILRLGDVLVFERGNTLIVHRLVSRLTDRETGTLLFVTAGDGLTYVDDPIDARMVLGKVIAIERDGKIKIPDGFSGRLLGLVRVSLARHPSVRTILRKIKLRVAPGRAKRDYSGSR